MHGYGAKSLLREHEQDTAIVTWSSITATQNGKETYEDEHVQNIHKMQDM